LLAAKPSSTGHKNALLRIVGLLVNKWTEPRKDSEYLTRATENLWSIITTSQSSHAVSHLPILFWMAKALILKCDKLGDSIVEKLIGLLSNEALGGITSRGFEVLLFDDELMNKENFGVVRLLSKQRLFTFCSQKLVDGFKLVAQGIRVTKSVITAKIC